MKATAAQGLPCPLNEPLLPEEYARDWIARKPYLVNDFFYGLSDTLPENFLVGASYWSDRLRHRLTKMLQEGVEIYARWKWDHVKSFYKNVDSVKAAFRELTFIEPIQACVDWPTIRIPAVWRAQYCRNAKDYGTFKGFKVNDILKKETDLESPISLPGVQTIGIPSIASPSFVEYYLKQISALPAHENNLAIEAALDNLEELRALLQKRATETLGTRSDVEKISALVLDRVAEKQSKAIVEERSGQAVEYFLECIAARETGRSLSESTGG
ncbi:hypothetical protein ABW19_dt0205872 [Dactylella cylindrospora]|nr:hypothetical protein ABW19_dt0205872 [Dactylella cylindrospora]